VKHFFDMYEDAFRRHGDSHEAVLWPKGRQAERFHALTRHIARSGNFSVLDYGCGLAHLKPYVDSHYERVAYTGADAVEAFVDSNRRKYPDAVFHQAQSPESVGGEFDYVVASGAFNILYTPGDPAAHRAIVYRILEQLFAKASTYLSINMMTDAVDFEQPHAYHQNVPDLYRFAIDTLSRRLVLDQSYMPYEFTLTLWKDQSIRRPEHVYGVG
jgi:trans-aconitate methyltransferase